MIRDTIRRLSMCPEWETCTTCQALRVEVQTAEKALDIAERRYHDIVRAWHEHDVDHTIGLTA